MAEYRVPSGYGEAEYVEKRSRFIGRVWRIETEEEATARIREMREKHWDASHNVYGYIVRDGGLMRYSDDGEPQGTSGMPTLNVFRAEEISNVCCVITRYFGGVLLGAGGLVRAYSKTAKLALDAAGVSVMRRWKEFLVSCGYAQYERVRAELETYGAVIRSTDFAADVLIEAMVPEAAADAFVVRVTDLTAGAVTPEPGGESWFPAPLG
jgi:uncharacterized YigZ family protein